MQEESISRVEGDGCVENLDEVNEEDTRGCVENLDEGDTRGCVESLNDNYYYTRLEEATDYVYSTQEAYHTDHEDSDSDDQDGTSNTESGADDDPMYDPFETMLLERRTLNTPRIRAIWRIMTTTLNGDSSVLMIPDTSHLHICPGTHITTGHQ